MKNLLNIFTTILLLFSSLGIYAQKVIKSIDINITLPKANEPIYEQRKVTAITTDLYGRLDNTSMGDTITCGISFLEFNDYGKRQQIHEDVFWAGRKYILQVHVSNYTGTLFNYKKDKNFTVDNTTITATVNGKPTKIILGFPRSITTDFVFTVEGEPNKWYTSITPSPADGKLNGHDYVDLELPSGNLWATCNVGTTKPEGFGDYFGWGETKTKNTYNNKNFVGYGAYCDSNPYNITSFGEEDNKYSVNGGPTGGRRLKFEHDAARQNMGGEWRMPTKDMQTELNEYCEKKYVVYNGVPGTLWISRINGKSIFTPYSGSKYEGKKLHNNNMGFFWTSNGHRVRQMQASIWGSQYDDVEQQLKNDPRVGWMLSTLGRGAGEAPEVGLPVRGVWKDGSKTDKSERKKKAQEANKVRKDYQFRYSADDQYEESDSGNSNNDQSTGNSDNTKEKKKKKSKPSLKGLLNKGKSLLDILN